MKVSELKTEIDGKFAEVDKRFERVDDEFKELRQLIKTEGDATRRYFHDQIKAEGETTRRYFDDEIKAEGETTRRHFDVVSEKMTSERPGTRQIHGDRATARRVDGLERRRPRDL